MTLRRHCTSPSVIAPVGRTIVRQPSSSNYRTTCMRSNPYVGFLRHSPPTTTTTTSKKSLICSSTAKNSWRQASWCYTAPLSLADSKNSPHIGWFRHAPPSRLDLSSTNTTSQTNSAFSPEEKELLWKIIQEMDPAAFGGVKFSEKALDKQFIYGSLPGGGKRGMEKPRRHRQRNNPFVTDFTESSAEGTMSTVNALSRLASWFLFPVAHDAESCGYSHQSTSPKQHKHQKKNKSSKKDDSLLNHLSPYLPSFLEEPHPPISNNQYSRYGARIDGNGPDIDDADDDSSMSSDSGSEASSTAVPPVTSTSNLGCSVSARDLTSSVSSLAEAYYAHQSATKDMDASSGSFLAPVHPASMSSTSLAVNPEHRLDYVITQMDIARMTRNASRHLDVQSILSLPVITYKKGINIQHKARWAAPQRPAQSSGDQAIGMSWTIVEESAVDFQCASAGSPNNKEKDAEFCVICLEHLEDGDRLRLLPCDHSFHVGCIDRWLSGSQSFDDCYTSGCPTCKKRPLTTKPRSQSFSEATSHNIRSGKNRSSSLDGSVPSWAFAQIGSALVAQQEEDQGATICSGESFSP